MATYLKGEKNYYPDIKAFTPDYKMLSATLDARENKYLQGWEETNDAYSRLYSDLTRGDTKDAQQQFIETLAPEIEKISGLDLSQQRNVNAAQEVFAPFFEDQLVVKDMVYTATYKDQMRTAQMLANSSDAKARDLYNPIAMEKMQFDREDFMSADRNQALGMNMPKFVKDADLYQNAQLFLSELDPALTITKPTFATFQKEDDKGVMQTYTDKQFIIKNTNGELIRGEAYNQIMRSMYDDPRVKEWYNAKTFVESRRFAQERINDGTSKSVGEGLNMWAAEVVRISDANNKKNTRALDDQVNQLESMTVTWQNYGMKNGLLPSEQAIVTGTQNEADQLKAELATAIETQELIASPDADDQALLNKAYGLLGQSYMKGDMNAAAYSYSKRGEKTELERNDFEFEDLQTRNKLKIQSNKYYYDDQMQEKLYDRKEILANLEAENSANLEKLKGLIKIRTDAAADPKTILNKGEGTILNSNDVATSLFNIDEEGEITSKAWALYNSESIAMEAKDILNIQKSQIGPMLRELRLKKDPNNTNNLYEIDFGDGTEIIPMTIEAIEDKLGETQPGSTTELKYIKLIQSLHAEKAADFKDSYNAYVTGGGDLVNLSSGYSKVYNELYRNSNEAGGLGIIQREQLHLNMIKENDLSFYNSTATSIEALKTGENLSSEQDRVREMITKYGYPTPLVDDDGLKSILSKKEYTDLFVKMAKAGKIINFDPSGIGDDSDGGSRADWTTATKGGQGRVGFDIKSAEGKASFIYDELSVMVNDKLKINGANTYVAIQRNLQNAAGSDLAFLPSVNITSTNMPTIGSEAETLMKYEELQRQAVSSSNSQELNIIPLPNDYDDLAALSLTGNDLVSDSAKASKWLYNNVLLNPDNKGVFEMTYLPNVGPQVLDDDDNIVSDAKAAYVIKKFDPKYVSTLFKADGTNQPGVPSFITTTVVNDLSENGIGFIFDRSENNDLNPASFKRGVQNSFIAQNIAISRTNQFKKDYPVDSTGFSPGGFVINMGSPGDYTATITTNTFVPLTQEDYDAGMPNFIRETKTVRMPSRSQVNAGGYLNDQYNQIISAIERQQSQNIVSAQRHRAALKAAQEDNQ